LVCNRVCIPRSIRRYVLVDAGLIFRSRRQAAALPQAMECLREAANSLLLRWRS